MNASITLLTISQEFSLFSVLFGLINSIGFICALFVMPVFVVYVLCVILVVVVANIIKTIDFYYDVPGFLKDSSICLNKFSNYPGISMPLIYSSGLAVYSALEPALSVIDANEVEEDLKSMIIDLKYKWKEAGLTEKEICREVMKIYVDLLWDKIKNFLGLIVSFTLRILTIFSLILRSLHE